MSNPILMIGMLFAVVVVFYFFGIRPQRKQERAAAEMRNNLSVGDEITTIGGIIGKVVSIKEETMVIETTRDHTRIRLLKTAVRSVDVPADEAKAMAKAAKAAKAEAKGEKPVKEKAAKEETEPQETAQNEEKSAD